MNSDRRRFDRLPLEEDAVAVDDSGRELGKVVHVGGGGMQVECSADEIARSLSKGTRLRVTVREPAANVANQVDVKVVHVDGRTVGFEFVGSR